MTLATADHQSESEVGLLFLFSFFFTHFQPRFRSRDPSWPSSWKRVSTVPNLAFAFVTPVIFTVGRAGGVRGGVGGGGGGAWGGCAVEAELFRKIKMKKRTSYKLEEKIYNNDIYILLLFL